MFLFYRHNNRDNIFCRMLHDRCYDEIRTIKLDGSKFVECSFQFRHLRERNHLNDHLPSIPFKNCLEARVDKLTLTLLLQWRSEFNRFGGRDLDLLVRMRMSSPSFNRLPSESRSFEWILQMIGGLEVISFANVRRNCAFEGEIICKWFGTRISRRL